MCWLVHRVTILGFVDEYRIDDRPVLFTEKMNLKKNDCRVWGSLGVLTWKTWSKLLRNRSLQSPGTTESMYRVPVALWFQKGNYGLLNLRPGNCKKTDFRFLYILDHWVSLRPDSDMRSSNPEITITQEYWSPQTMSYLFENKIWKKFQTKCP